tara:strand:+ start:556 stop:816 length:261 start_codon:yes stop_codon:yes gene_type:complete
MKEVVETQLEKGRRARFQAKAMGTRFGEFVGVGEKYAVVCSYVYERSYGARTQNVFDKYVLAVLCIGLFGLPPVLEEDTAVIFYVS